MRTPSEYEVDKWMALMEPSILQYVGLPLGRVELSRLAGIAIDIIGRAKSKNAADQISAAYASLSHLEGSVVDIKRLRRNMMRLVANWDIISDGVPIPMWDGTKATATVLFIGVAPIGHGSTTQKLLVKLKLKTGLPAGIIKYGALPAWVVSDFLQHKAGIARYECPDAEISGLRCRALVQLMPDGMLKLSELECTERQKKSNVELAEKRGDIAKCTNVRPCNTCPATISQCPLAVWLDPPKEVK